ncbi:BQ2448_4652 [Microbotryum intermedium]|uniref:Protein transport protein sec16 n=1 Tax=Microbotryum intermedium TaxID=269621 RepID=A0A238FL98_9BASI|nr:BQ2448_4652 [Microbotryum intermedium]
MSGYGGGPPPRGAAQQQQYAHQQQQQQYHQQPSQQHLQQHDRSLASVGSASALFGDQLNQDDDLFNVQHQLHQQYGQIDTVMEEDEPDSPQMNRYGQPAQSQPQQQQYQDYDQQQHAGYDEQPFEPPYYPGFIYDAASNSYLPDPQAQAAADESWGQGGQYDQSGHYDQQGPYDQQRQYDYSNEQQQQQHEQQYGDYSHDQPQQNQDQGQHGGEYDDQPFEPPYYPGFIYDATSNSYLPDPNAQAAANETWDDQSGWDPSQQQEYSQEGEGPGEGGNDAAATASIGNQQDLPDAAPSHEETINWNDHFGSAAPETDGAPFASSGNGQQPEDWSQYDQYDESNVFGEDGGANAYEQQGYSYDQTQDTFDPYSTNETSGQSPSAATAAAEPAPDDSSVSSIQPPPPPPAASQKPVEASQPAHAEQEHDSYNQESYEDEGGHPEAVDTTWGQEQGDYEATSWDQQNAQGQQEDTFDPYAQQGQASWEHGDYGQARYEQVQGQAHDSYPEQEDQQHQQYDAYAPTPAAAPAPPPVPVAASAPPRQATAPPPSRAQPKPAVEAASNARAPTPPRQAKPLHRQPEPQAVQANQSQQQEQQTQPEDAPYDPYAPVRQQPRKFSPVHAPSAPSSLTSPSATYSSTFSPPPRSSSRGSTRSTSSSVAGATPKRGTQPPSASSTAALNTAAPPPRMSGPPKASSAVVPPPQAAFEAPPRPSSAASNASSPSSMAARPRSDSRSSSRSTHSNGSSASMQPVQPSQSRQAPTAAPPGRVLSPPPQASAAAGSRNAGAPPANKSAAPPRAGQRAAITPTAQFQSFAAPLDAYEPQPEAVAPASAYQPQQQRKEAPKPQPRQQQVPAPQAAQAPAPKQMAPAASAAPPAPKKTAGAGGYVPFDPALAAQRKAAAKPVASRLPPPVQPRRAPHQRGASAFAGDSPYATLPEDLPPMPGSSASESIGEEEEDPAPIDDYAPPPAQASSRNAPPPASRPQQPPQQRPAPQSQSQGPQDSQGEQVPSWMDHREVQPQHQSAQQYDNPQSWETSSVSSQTSSASRATAPGAPPKAQTAQAPQDSSTRPPIRGARKNTPRYAAPLTSTAPSDDGVRRMPNVVPVPVAVKPTPAQSRHGQPPMSKAAPPSRAQQATRPLAASGVAAPPRAPASNSQQTNATRPQPRPGALKPATALQGRQSQPLANIRETAAEPHAVPALNFEAPSPEIRPQADQNDMYAPSSLEDDDPNDDAGTERDQSVIEHPSGSYDDSFAYSQRQEYSGYDSQHAQYGASNNAYEPSHSDEQTIDDAQVYGPGGMSTSTSGSNYGDWNGTSEAQSGYDYVSNGIDSLSLADPYNPNQTSYDYPQAPSRDSNYTPQTTRTTSNYASPVKPAQAPRSHEPAQSENHGYQPQQTQGAPYNPYAAQQQSQQGYALQAEFDGPPADLQLDRSTAPVISWGLGGKLVTAFPSTSQASYGYGAPTSSGVVQVRKLAEVLASPESSAPFPGPMFLDGGKANAGKKRKEAVAWLEARTAELEKEVSYLQGAGPGAFGSDFEANKRKLEVRLILFKLVKVLVENEGKLLGTPKIEEAVRSILVPLSEGADLSEADLPTASQLAAAAAPLTPATTGSIANYTVTESNLDKLSSFLLRGERRKAVQYALDHRLWAHAFVISSCVDTDCWKEVVLAFLQSELTPSVENSTGGATGREAMRVSYAMFAGLEAESIQQFVPPVSLAPSMLSPKLLPSSLPTQFSPTNSLARRSSNAAENMLNRNLPESVLATWQETCAMIVANRALGDSAALTALGDALAANEWTDAAHVCYLLSPATSPIGGPGSPGARFALLGASTSALNNTSPVDIESIQLTELIEFAFSLTPAVKGQEPFIGFPHLQAYRLEHAARLADNGQIAQAQKYTDAIIATLKLATKPSPYYTPRLAGEVKAVADRLHAVAGQDKSGSWLGRMVPKGPTKEGLWSTLEGGFTKFVAGDGETSQASLAAKAEVAKAANGAPLGPFSHYSSIAPDSNSGTLSRVASSVELTVAPPSRPHSSAALISPSALVLPANHHQASPGPPPVKRAPFKTHHSRSSSLGVAGYNYDPNAPPPWQAAIAARQAPPVPASDATPRASAQDFTRTPQNAYGYGSASFDDLPPNEGGLRAPAFAQVDQGAFSEDESGFISPMAAYTPAVSPVPAGTRAYNPAPHSHRRTTTQDELDDLGISNNKSKKPGFDSIGEGEEEEMGVASGQGQNEDGNGSAEASSGTQKEERPTIRTAPSRSWLGGWFKRDSPSPVQNGPGPVRANLGEQTSFVYDAELKRWVNRKAGDSGASTPITTVPPPRASTASPSRSSRARYNTETPPPMPSMPPSRHDTSSAPPPSLNRSQTTSDLRSSAASGAGRKKPNRYIPVP